MNTGTGRRNQTFKEKDKSVKAEEVMSILGELPLRISDWIMMGYLMLILLLTILSCNNRRNIRWGDVGTKRFYDSNGNPLKNGKITFLSCNGLRLIEVQLNDDGGTDDGQELFNIPQKASFIQISDCKGVVLMIYELDEMGVWDESK